MFQPNFERIAKKIVRDNMGTKPGDQVLIDVRNDAISYAELIAEEIFKMGGVVTLMLRSDELTYRQIMDTPIEHLSLPWAGTNAALRAADYNVTIGLEYLEPERFSDLPPERFMAYEERRKARSVATYSQQTGYWLGTDYPTRYMAQAYGLAWGRFFETFWRAMDVDYGELSEQALSLSERLGRADVIHITTPRGTDLRLRRGDREVIVDYGLGQRLTNLPAGEVFFAPIEESTEGRVVFDLAFQQGTRISGLEFQFEGGVATPIGASERYDEFLNVWNLATGDKARLGEVGIGINPEIMTAVGYDLLDPKVYGGIQLTFGYNQHTGGNNESSLRWSMYLMQPTLLADDDLILRFGRFV